MLDQVIHRVPAVVALPAEIDLTSAERAYGELHAAFAGGAAAVIADFSATTFCDCSSLRRLLAVQHRAACRDARLVLVIPRGSPVSRLAELVSLDSRLPVYPSLREAVAELRRGTAKRQPPGGG
jgi:anti-sigma B factor antagonist